MKLGYNEAVGDVEHTTENQSTFAVKTEVFEGPLELLLDLIEKRKLLISDISLASVTDEYMAHVAKMQENSVRNTAQFVVVAATLLLIKSKSLLPVLELTEKEEENIDDLERRLKEYQIYRSASNALRTRFGAYTMYSRRYIRNEKPLFITDAYCSVTQLNGAIESVVTGLPKIVKKPKVAVKSIISLEEVINALRERVERQMKFYFNDFTKNSREKTTVIVSFLAVLEMVKQGNVMVRQAQHFDDIEIEREEMSTPRYI